MAIYNYGIGGNEVKSRCERIHRGNPLQPNFDSSKTDR